MFQVDSVENYVKIRMQHFFKMQNASGILSRLKYAKELRLLSTW